MDTEDNASGRNVRAGPGSNPDTNPVFGPKMQLYCRTGWMLGMYGPNDVRGSVEDFDPHSK